MSAPIGQGWVYDFVYHYRLDEAIIRRYLKEQFGDCDFQVVVSRHPTRKNPCNVVRQSNTITGGWRLLQGPRATKAH